MLLNLNLKIAGVGAIIGILSACVSILAMLAYLWFIGFFPSITAFRQISTMTSDIFIRAIVTSTIIGFFVGLRLKLRKFHAWEKTFLLAFIVVIVMLLLALPMFNVFLNPHTMSFLLLKKDAHLTGFFGIAVTVCLSICIFSCFLVCLYLLYKYFFPADSSISTDVDSTPA